jgi:hypothetical protein
MVEDKSDTASPEELERVNSEMNYWVQWGEPLGLALIGWTDRRAASFVDRESGRAIFVATYRGMGGDANFAFFDRIRNELLAAKEKAS